MVKKIGGMKSRKGVNPRGGKHAGNMPTSDELTMRGKSARVKKSSIKGALIDGPYGGRKPQS